MSVADAIGRVREIQGLAQPQSAAAAATPVVTTPAATAATPAVASFASQLQQSVAGQTPALMPTPLTTTPLATTPLATAPLATTMPTTATTAQAGVPAQYGAMVQQAATANGVDPALVAAVARAESNWNPGAVSPAGAQGLMQLMPGTARGLGVTNSFDPAQALNGGARYLREMLDRFGGDVRLALAGYNAGPGAVARYGGVPPYAETQAYVQRVTGYLNAYRAGGVA